MTDERSDGYMGIMQSEAREYEEINDYRRKKSGRDYALVAYSASFPFHERWSDGVMERVA
jgi:hypothetical protein